MTVNLDSELLTIAEAAALLKVTRVTVSRWLKQGRLPAYRVGPRAVRIRRADLARVLRPVQPEEPVTETETEEAAPDGAPGLWRRPWPEPDPKYVALLPDRPPLTEEEKAEELAMLDEVQAHQEQMLARRGGRPLPESWPIINEARDERSAQL